MEKYSDVDVYFHRLAPGSPSDEVLRDFYEDNIVLCHYENKSSFSDDDYDESTDIETMVEFAESGGICLIQLDADNEYYDRSRRLGVVPAGTEPFIIGVESDGTRTQRFTDPDKATQELDDNPNVEYIYKAVQLQENIRELASDEFLLTSYEPPSTTFTPWYVVADQIRSILSGESLPIEEPTSYSPDQTERLCEEYLREEHDYYPLIQPGGSSGTNQSFDLIGGIDDDRVFGEVKNTKGTSDSALDDLEAEATEGSRAFYFSRNSVEQSREGVEIVLISEVIETLQSIDRTNRMMEEMTTW